MAEHPHEHCWHLTASWTDYSFDYIKYICCHCGIENTVQHAHKNEVYSYNAKEHGPFYQPRGTL